MGNPNRGKDFEQKIKEAILQVDGVSLDRLPDPTNGYMGVRNICDFMIYKYPYQYYIECKCTHDNTLNFTYIRDNQKKGLYEKSFIRGVVAGVIVWFIKKDRTIFVPIQTIYQMIEQGVKSIPWNFNFDTVLEISGEKQRIFYRYDMADFFNNYEIIGGRQNEN